MSALDNRLSRAFVLGSALFAGQGCGAEEKSANPGNNQTAARNPDLGEVALPIRDKFLVTAEEFVDSFENRALVFEHRRQTIPTVFKATSVAPRFAKFKGFPDAALGEVIGGRAHGEKTGFGAWRQPGCIVEIEVSNSYGGFISLTGYTDKYKFEASDIDLPAGLKVAGIYLSFGNRFNEGKMKPAPEAGFMPQPLVLGPHPLHPRTRQVLFHTEADVVLADSQLSDFAAIKDNKLTLTIRSEQFLGAPLPIIFSGLGLSSDPKDGPVVNTAAIGVLLVQESDSSAKKSTD